MNENLPQKYKKGLLHRTLNKLKKILNSIRKNTAKTDIKNNISVSEYETVKENKIELLKNSIDQTNLDLERKEFIKILTDNPQLLENFSNEKLEKILQYYIEENKKKMELLKRKRT